MSITEQTELIAIELAKFSNLKSAYIELATAYHTLANIGQSDRHTSLSVYRCEELTCRSFLARLNEIESYYEQ